ncbi:MFS transporter [Alicyclobacillus ferrooxydans]|uniref:MFS transporter n=1 Tax=Alicyclobacillus ferrooxydans TaxID=471514 RepID=A0A0P9CLJ5_9BACL|nr:MFS transporter [Alicyclobacillus ferrooxydans]KPV43886.1 MFS transporter [Alicyclobacillus ferrooxydans]
MFQRLRVILLMLVTVFIGFGLIIPVVPLMVTNVGAQAIQLGLLLAVYSAVSFFMSPYWGRLSDRIGRRPILIIGLFGYALSFLVFGFASHLLWLMYLSRIIGGGFSGAVTSTAMAYIADVTDVENRTKGMAFAGMSIGFGFIIGPAVGGLLGGVNISLPFFVAAALAILNALWGLFALDESLSPQVRQARHDHSREQKLSRWAAFQGSLKYMYLVDFVSQFTISALEGCLQLFEMWKIHATAEQIGWMFFISGVVGALIQGGIVRRYVTHGREVPTLYIGLFVSAVGLVLLIFSKNFATAAIYMTVFGAGNTVLKPTLTSLVTKETKVGQGLANGLLSSMDSLARMVGPVLATLVYEVHVNLPFLLAAAVAILAMGLVASYQVSKRHETIVKIAS